MSQLLLILAMNFGLLVFIIIREREVQNLSNVDMASDLTMKASRFYTHRPKNIRSQKFEL